MALVLGCSDKNVRTFNDNPEVSITSHQNGDVVNEGYVIEFRQRSLTATTIPMNLRQLGMSMATKSVPFYPPMAMATALAPPHSVSQRPVFE